MQPTVLGYSPVESGRLKRQTAIAVVSILLGCGGALLNLRIAARARLAILVQRFMPAIGPWTESEITLALAEIGPGILNGRQETAFRQIVTDPRTTFLCYRTHPIASASMISNGGVRIFTSQSGDIELDANGRPITQVSANRGQMPLFFIAGEFATTPLIALATVSVVDAALAIVLLIAGILTLTSTARGMQLHRHYARAKIILELLGVGAFGWFMSRLLSHPAVVVFSGREAWGETAWYAGVVMFGIGYAILLLFVCNPSGAESRT